MPGLFLPYHLPPSPHIVFPLAADRLTPSPAQPSFTYDLNTAIPFWSLAPEERKAYWDDHIHLTPAGYDLMGEKIAARLVEIIMPPGRLQPQQANGGGATRRKKIFKDDDKIFEEEDGDEHKLENGYYVVRRKDLE